jgi:hypothetical protein
MLLNGLGDTLLGNIFVKGSKGVFGGSARLDKVWGDQCAIDDAGAMQPLV